MYNPILPVSLEQAQVRGSLLEKAFTDPVFIVALKAGAQIRFYIESSDESYSDSIPATDEEGEPLFPEEVLLRIFTDRDHATRYMDSIKGFLDDTQFPFTVVSSSFDEFFSAIMMDLPEIEAGFEAPLRIDLCLMPEDSHPKSVDTVFSRRITHH